MLPLLAAFVIGTRGLTEDITERAFKNVTAAGGDWATVTWDGRDAAISGDAPSQEAIDNAVAAVAETYGVRRIASSARVVAPPPKVELPLPTVESLLANTAQPEIRGTWPEGAAKNLAVTLGGAKYALGQNNELSSAAGAWVLKPSAPLADGEYDVAVEISDGATVTAAAAPGKLTIDTKAPEMPSLSPIAAGSVWPFALTGKWAEGDAAGLTAKLAGKSFTLGKDADLSSDGQGNWTLAPKFDLAPGSYDLELESQDKAGNTSTAKLAGAIVIAEPLAPSALAPPTIDPLITNLATPKITGTWPEDQAKSLTVIVNGVAKTLGASAELISEAGRWTFTPAAPLADGSFEVSAEITDAAGNKIVSAGATKVVVDTTPPAAPAISGPPQNAAWPYALTGTWPEGQATLEAEFAGRNWALGKDPQLTSDGKGNWRFDPAMDLAPGSYDLSVVARDAAGNSSAVNLPAAVVIAAAEQPAPPLAETPKAEEPPAQPAEPPKAEEPPVQPAEPPKAEAPPPQPAEQPKAEEQPPPPPAAVPPTVASITATATRPVISGTVSPGTTLKVSLAGRQYVQGTDESLNVDGQGNWTLAAQTPLGDGAYEVIAESTDAAGKTLMDSTSNELTVDAAGPASPTVTLQSVEGAIAQVSGTWAEGDAKTLRVAIPAASLDAAAAPSGPLVSDGKGNWTLALAEPLRPGSYDVVVETADALGRVSRDQTRFELLVKEPYDCEAALAQLAGSSPVRFEFRRTRINPPYDAAVDAYAEFMKDPRCAGFSMTVEGHADTMGPESFNQQLSELRAMQVVDAMVSKGADPSRLATIGMSENLPLEKGRSVEKRKMNRRVEFKLSK
ncbi:MAG: OmpA family protein [Rhodospirillales bacterium]|nr:OmpA family protein [Rhodospirillales bacterium]